MKERAERAARLRHVAVAVGERAYLVRARVRVRVRVSLRVRVRVRVSSCRW